VVVSAHENVRRIFEITGLDGIVRLYRSLDDDSTLAVAG
jgi:anti-anti-sigma regulatory factor